jgi:Flp pilus assembly protein TadG
MKSSQEASAMRAVTGALILLLFPRRARRVPALSSESGGSLVEFAIVLPMMMVLITGMYTFGIALSNYVMLTNAVGAGARAFAISPAVTINTGSGTTTITDPCAYAIQMATQSTPTIPAGGVTYTISYTPLSTGKTTTYTTGTCKGIATAVGDTVQLQALYPYNFVFYGVQPGTLNLQARSAELVQ